MDIILLVVMFFLIMEVAVIAKILLTKSYFEIFWFCDFAPFLFALGFLGENWQFIKALINIGLLTQLATSTLLTAGFVSGKDIIGTKWSLRQGKFYTFVELMIHLLPTNVAFFLTYKIQPQLISLGYSFLILVFIYFFTLLFTPPKKNINLLYNNHISYESDFIKFILPYQTRLWILYAFIVVLITFLVQYLVYFINL